MTSTHLERRMLPRFTTTLLLLGVASFAACEPPGITAEQVAQYHAATALTGQTSATEEIDAYFDYSLGMGEGMKATAERNQALSDFLRGRTVRYYRVGNSQEPEPIADMASPKAILLNLENFQEINSRLQRVVEMAVSADNRQSVFVTDFEATLDDKVMTPGAPRPHRIDTKAWAQESFRRWLLAGHRLDIFARRYRKPDWWFGNGTSTLLDNWIYTIVFTPKAVMQDEQAFAKSVVAFLLEEQTRHASPDERHFAFWADDFRIDARNDQTTGNANPDSPVRDVANGSGNPPYDFHSFSAGDVQEWLAEAVDDRRLLNGLRIEPRLAFARSVELGLQVTDVTSAIESFTAEAEPQPVPDTLVDKETGKVTLIDPETQKPFVPRSPATKIRVVKGDDAPGVFAFVHNTKTHDVGVKLDTAFATPSGEKAYRADVVVRNVIQKNAPDESAVLSLSYTSGFRVSALAESLRLAVRDVASSMRGRVLYSSYVIMRP